jgi:hypothetical protein
MAGPVIVLAFANEQAGEGYLRHLPDEVRALQRVFPPWELSRSLTPVFLTNASPESLLEALRGLGDRVVAFHYGGHAGPDRCLLEGPNLGGEAAHAAGLAAYIGLAGPPHLAFLNGCATERHIAGLHAAGVKVVVATDRSIQDAMAREFAEAYYRHLAAGASVAKAFAQAENQLRIGHRDDPEAYTNRDLVPADEPAPVGNDPASRFPWIIRPAPASEQAVHWSLREATSDPLLGFANPQLPPAPTDPYLGLTPFTRNDAAIFFGRRQAIADLLRMIETSNSPPVILFHGQTGVGKSSVLDAGLKPWLEPRHTVLYKTRSPERGLLGTLVDTLSPTSDDARSHDLRTLWTTRAAEFPDKPLVVIIDQAEEAFTRPLAAISVTAATGPLPQAELALFFTALAGLFDPAWPTRDKLLVSFRKEWLTEFQTAARAVGLDCPDRPLGPLDRAEIINAIEGPARDDSRSPSCRPTIAPGLAAEIADDLLALISNPSSNRESPVAPTLQILLRRMWDEGKRLNQDAPVFDRDLYIAVKKQGYGLREFLDKRIEDLQAQRRPEVKLGLILDLLEYHTSSLGTATSRDLEDLRTRYAHAGRPGLIDELVTNCTTLYLLVKLPTGATRLPHDTLAPLVHEKFRSSTAPGQRARRLLENRIPEWQDGRIGHTLDRVDLETVEEGQTEMRAWTEDEKRLVKASRIAERTRRAGELWRKRWRRFFLYTMAIALPVTTSAAIVAWVEWRNAQENVRFANTQTEIAREQASIAAQRERIATAQRLVSQSYAAFPGKPLRGLILAVEAIRVTRDVGEAVAPVAEEAIHDALSSVQGRPFPYPTGLKAVLEFAPDGRIATGGNDGTLKVWELTNPTSPPLVLPGARKQITRLAFAPDGRLIAGSQGGVVEVWDLTNPQAPPLKLDGQHGVTTVLSVLPDSRLVAGSDDGATRIWDLKHPRLQPVTFSDRTARITALAVAPGRWLAAANEEGTARVWDIN